MKYLLLPALLLGCAFAADKPTIPQLLDLAGKPNDPAFAQALTATFGVKPPPGPNGVDRPAPLQEGTAIAGEGPNFIWAYESPAAPELYVDDQRVAMLSRIGNSNTWFYRGQLKTGTSHVFYYMVNGNKMGGKNDIPAYGPESYAKAGVPQGKLSEKMVHTSKLYEGMQSNYWTYVPAHYDPAKPACLMVWHDGQGLANRNGAANSLNVFDNLTAEGKIPVIIHVFISPGTIGPKAMRSVLYDTVSDKYPTFLRDELLPEVYAKYNIRKDGYSRAIAGGSSGGISSFNAAWFQNDQFTRVLMRIASFANLQQNHPGQFDGGNTYPYRVRREEKRNMRVWTQDGQEDLENPFGSWPANNMNMANSLKFRDYDFHFSFGVGTHNGAQGNAELPEAMLWLWRGYDAAKTQDTFPPDPEEKNKPFYRIKAFNR